MSNFIAGVFDEFFGLLTPAQWETWRNWVTTIGGLVALTIAANTYRRNGNLKREEQARLVYTELTSVIEHWEGGTFPIMHDEAVVASFNGAMQFVRDSNGETTGEGLAEERLIQATIRIHNNSKEMIGPIRVQLTYIRNEWAGTPGLNLGTVAPETNLEVVLIGNNEAPIGQFTMRPRLLFRDASGVWWNRDGTEPIKRVHNDPENPVASDIMNIRSGNERLIHLGNGRRSDQSRAVRVPLSAHWHRLGRRLRGKPSIP